MRKKNWFFTVLCFIMACMVFVGCQGSKNGGDEQKDNKQPGNVKTMSITEGQMMDYEADFFDVSGVDPLFLSDARIMNDHLYFMSYDEQNGRYRIDRVNAENGQKEVFLKYEALDLVGEEASENSFGLLRCFDVTKDGGIMALIACYADGKDEMDVRNTISYQEAEDYILAEYDSFGSMLRNVSLGKESFQNLVYSMKMGVDGQGNVLVISDKGMLFNAEGKRVGVIPMEEGDYLNGFAHSQGGDLYCLMTKNNFQMNLLKLDFRRGEALEVEGMPEHMERIGSVEKEDAKNYNASEDSILVLANGRTYQYFLLERKLVALMEWSACGIKSQEIMTVNRRGDKLLALNRKDNAKVEFAVLKSGQDVMPVERKTLVLAALKKHSVLNNLVSDYNRSQKEYMIEIVEYAKDAKSSLEYQEPANRMIMDLLGDNPPDLVDLVDFYSLMGNLEPNPESILEKGYVVDLSPYLEKGAGLSKDDFEEKVLQAYTFDKGITAIPSRYMLSTLTAGKQELGKRFGWSVWEFIEYDKSHPDMPPVANCDRKHIYSLCIRENIKYFVDFENKTVRFDCPEFRGLLEYANSYPQGDGFIPNNAEEKLVAQKYINAVYMIQRIRNEGFGGEAQFISYPSIDGKPLVKINVDSDGHAIAITERCQDKEGAWKFIEYALNADPMGDSNQNLITTIGGIPTNKRIAEKWLDILSSPNGPLKKDSFSILPDGREYHFYPFSEEEREIYDQLLDAATFDSSQMIKVKKIVYEELQPYFAEQKTADQVIEVIENRVRLFLQEQ